MPSCCVKTCSNSQRNSTHVSFFKLPSDDRKCRLWLKAVGREDLLSRRDFKPLSYVVCSEHFELEDFRLIRRYLSDDAVPSQFVPIETENSKNTGEDDSRYGTVDVKNPSILANKENDLNQVLSAKQHPQSNINNKPIFSETFVQVECNETTRVEPCVEPEYPDDEVGNRFRKLIKMQNKLKEELKGTKNNFQYKMYALNMHYTSPFAYRCLQTVLELPDTSTLSSLNISIPPKLDDRVLSALELKIKHLPDNARHCTISIGEIPLKRNMYYNIKTDEIIGFHDVNGKVLPEVASLAFVITLQGLEFKWEHPIAYALLAGQKHLGELDNWLSDVINKLTGMGIKVRAIISDQDSNYDKFTKNVKEITAEKPYFICNGNKVYYLYDVLYLAKYIHAALPTSNYFWGGHKIAWKYIKELYKDQLFKNFRLIPNITEAHIKPDSSHQTGARCAKEIFSETVASALHTYIDLDKISEKARPTADFVQTMNNLLDVFNSSKLKSNTSLSQQNKVLDEADEMFKTLQAVDKATGQENASNMECFLNFQITIKSVKMINEDLKNEGCESLCTGQLNRNSLESFVHSIRQQTKNEPTPVQFRRAFSKLVVRNMLKKPPAKFNSEIDISNILLIAEDVINSALSRTKAPSPKSVVHLNGETDYRINLPKENAATYIAAYLWYKCTKKHACARCEDVLKSVSDIDDTNLRDKYKNYNKSAAFYSGLKMPPEEFVSYVQQLEKKIRQQFRNHIQTNPGKGLYKVLRQSIPSNAPCICFPVDYMLKLFVRLRIYTTLKFNNRQYKNNVS